MKNTIRNLFINRQAQLRSGWKISLMLVVYFISALLMASLAGVVYGILGRAAGKSTLQLIQEASMGLNSDPVFLVIRTLFVLVGAVGSVLAVWRLLDKKPASELGFTSYKTGLPQLLTGLAIGAVSMSLVFVFLLVTGNIELVGKLGTPNVTPALLSGLVTFIGVGLSEEVFSRGYCMTVLKQTGSVPAILLISAGIFSLLHLGNANVSLTGLINIFLVGILLSLMFMRTGSLWMPIGFHITWNYFQGTVFGLEVSGMGLKGMYTTRLVSENIINGGTFGPEGGLAVTAVILAGIALEYYLMRRNNQ